MHYESSKDKKKHQYENWKQCTAKIMMGLERFSCTESVVTVKSNIARFCDFQTARSRSSSDTVVEDKVLAQFSS